jgi:hypothetical protein
VPDRFRVELIGVTLGSGLPDVLGIVEVAGAIGDPAIREDGPDEKSTPVDF